MCLPHSSTIRPEEIAGIIPIGRGVTGLKRKRRVEKAEKRDEKKGIFQGGDRPKPTSVGPSQISMILYSRFCVAPAFMRG